MRLLRISMLGSLFVVAVSAQQKQPSKSAAKPGIVSGRVFAITKSGDLKPARLAKVYLFYESGSKGTDPDTAGLTWTLNLAKGLEENNNASEARNKVLADLDKERQATQAAEDRAMAQGD